MLELSRFDPDTFMLVSDDANAENALLQDVIEEAAPELLDSFAAAEVQDDGKLRFTVARADWPSLLDALDALAGTGNVDPGELDPILKAVDDEVNPS